jgi:hypothetical protein
MILQIGSRGEDVLALQQWLNNNGFLDGQDGVLAEDGQFGPRTEQALISFQESAGITPDGKHGPQTATAQEEFTAAEVTPEAAVEETVVLDETVELDELEQGGESDYEVTPEADIPTTDWESIFVGMMGSIGISETAATGMWTTAEELFTDPNYDVTNIFNDLYRKTAEGEWVFPQFMERFPAIETLFVQREEGDTNLYVPTPQEYLAYEQNLQNHLNNYGFSAADTNSLTTELLVNGVGTLELDERFTKVDIAMNQLPDEINAVFTDWYGADTERNIAAIFLDPDDAWAGGKDGGLTWAESGNIVDESIIAARGIQYGNLELTQARAASIRELGLQESAIWTSFQNLAGMEELFAEKLGEQDFTAEEEGVEGALFGGTEVEKRRQSRVAEFSGGGGAFISGEGTGLGSA